MSALFFVSLNKDVKASTEDCLIFCSPSNCFPLGCSLYFSTAFCTFSLKLGVIGFPLLLANDIAPDLVGLAFPTAEKITNVAITLARSAADIFLV